jgi:hypothetical protein
MTSPKPAGTLSQRRAASRARWFAYSLGVVGSSLVLLVAPAPATAQNPIENPDAVVGTSPTGPEPGSTTDTEAPGAETPGAETPGTGTPGTGTPGTGPPRTGTPGIETPGASGETAGGDAETSPRSEAYGNAARRTHEVKTSEAARDCGPRRPPNSRMLAVGGSVTRDEGTSLGWVALAIAAGAAMVAIVAYRAQRRRSSNGAPGHGPLEVSATVVAICAGLGGLAVQLIPGVGAQHPPPTEASMAVREVHARITRGEYATKTGADLARIRKIDRREVGDVIWLEIELRGYRDRDPRLQYALYDPDRSGTLLPGTDETVDLRVEDSDAQTLFVPVWVGFPSSERFQAKFRLLDGDVVRQIADTNALRSSQFRYACEKNV